MKSYHLKSLLFLACFVFAAIAYYNLEQNEVQINVLQSDQSVDLNPEDEIEEDVFSDQQAEAALTP